MQYHYSVTKQEPHQRPHRSVAHILIILIKSYLSSSASASNQHKPPALSCALPVHSHTYCLSLSACIPAAQHPNDLHTQLQMELIMRKGLSVASTLHVRTHTRAEQTPYPGVYSTRQCCLQCCCKRQDGVGRQTSAAFTVADNPHTPQRTLRHPRLVASPASVWTPFGLRGCGWHSAHHTPYPHLSPLAWRQANTPQQGPWTKLCE